MNSNNIEERELWKAYLRETIPGSAKPGTCDINDLAGYLDRTSEDESTDRMELLIARSDAGLRAVQDMRAVLDDSFPAEGSAGGESTLEMPAHVMGRIHSAVQAAIVSDGTVEAETANAALVPAPTVMKRIFNGVFGKRDLSASGVVASGTFESGAFKSGNLWSGVAWAAAIMIMAFVGYWGFTIGEETGDGRGGIAGTQTETDISRPDLLFAVDADRRKPNMMPIGYELGVAE